MSTRSPSQESALRTSRRKTALSLACFVALCLVMGLVQLTGKHRGRDVVLAQTTLTTH